ncbi:hypothetical protein SteCoe_36471 [Stentor coeruleus]|uniref:Calcineurin-like phosphoesterase domain-containing protein n=1 Tax=Stentor coeruleus TaxID=5963 RepID=A0A1R2AQ30_9CILI|nr:hypothetical protein SteCoe_36471 [Stentor coeruleus]
MVSLFSAILAVAYLSFGFGKFFVITDLHYDIGYNSSYNSTYYCHSMSILNQTLPPSPSADIQPVIRPFCDSSLNIINITLQQMQSVDPNPEFIMVTGDSIGHFTTSFISSNGDFNPLENIELFKKSFVDISKLIYQYFPKTQIIPMIGNNDAYQDYKMPTGWDKLDYIDFLYSIWKPLVGQISSTFFTDGYYNTKTSISGYNVIVLNTMYFDNTPDGSVIQGQIEILWLKNQLNSNSKNIITMHIPPGFALYNGGSQSWSDYFTKSFMSLVQEYQSKIVGIFAGHYHSGYFQLIGQVPVIINPSISPIFGNNPAFRYYDLDNNDYTEFTFNAFNPSNTWYNSTFSSVYGYPMNYTRLYDDIDSGKVTINNYLQRLTGYWILSSYNQTTMCNIIYGKACNDPSNLQTITTCGIMHHISTEYYSCLQNSLSNFS